MSGSDYGAAQRRIETIRTWVTILALGFVPAVIVALVVGLVVLGLALIC